MTYPLRDWFLDGKDIRREVISADIQSFLGNDATVRPGRNLVDGIEVRALAAEHTPAKQCSDTTAGQGFLDQGIQEPDYSEKLAPHL